MVWHASIHIIGLKHRATNIELILSMPNGARVRRADARLPLWAGSQLTGMESVLRSRDHVYRRAKPECVCICVFRLVELGSSWS